MQMGRICSMKGEVISAYGLGPLELLYCEFQCISMHVNRYPFSYVSCYVLVMLFDRPIRRSTGPTILKVKLSTPWRRIGEWRYSSTHSLISGLDGGEWSASRHGRFTPPPRGRATGTHWIRGWVGSRAVLDAVVKRKIPIPRWESNPRVPIVQPVA
jgi:hypothetical protein